MQYRPLTRAEMISVIEGRSDVNRIPVILNFWINESEFGDRKGIVEGIKGEYPQDAQIIEIVIPEVFDAPLDDSEYRWTNYDDPYKGKTIPLDQRVAINDWSLLDRILKEFPNPCYGGAVKRNVPDDGRYRLGHWWYCLFERHWQLRGMVNALMDYYTDPESVHRLFRAITDFYMVIMERGKKELNLDGIFTSDDLGMQTGPFFSMEIFEEFYRPYYAELIEKAHSLEMHFWLHSCGCIEKFLPAFIELGLDVIHPIQKNTMDEKNIADKYGKDICIWAGFDVQQVIPWGAPEDVCKEVRFMIDSYYRPEGKLMFTAGNGINGDCPVESLKALYKEAFEYGTYKAGTAEKRFV